MSFVKKALKKVWKVTKKIVKSKVFKYLAVAAAVFFTAGIAAAGGFAAFGASMSAATLAGSSTLGAFFSTVGATIATGASSLASMVGLKGISGGLAQYGGSMATAAGLTGAPGVGLGVTLSGAVGVGPATTTNLATGQVISSTVGTAAPAKAGFAGTMAKFLGKPILGDVTTGQLLANGATAGFTAVLQAKQKEKDFPNGYVAGGLMRGGGSSPPPAHTYSVGSTGQSAPTPTTPEAGPTVAAQLANQEAPQVGTPDAGQVSTERFMGARQGIDSISARLAARDQQPASTMYGPQGGLVMGQQAGPQVQQERDPYAPVRNQATQLQYQTGGLV